MTYISIDDEIARLRADGQLRLLEPLLPGSHARVILMAAKLFGEVIGPWPEDGGQTAFRMGRLRRDLDRFLLNEHITVGHGDDERCDLKPLMPEKDEVWEFRSRAPKPSLRLFGHFACPDVLVLTNMQEREVLGQKRSREWAVEVGGCKAEWGRLFPYCPPHHGEKVHDYITANVTDISDFEVR